MPEFATVSLKEALLRTATGRQGRIISEYADYIQQLPPGQAGKLHVVESENSLTIRRRLTVAATALNIPLTIRRSGADIYFWREDGEEAESRRRRGRRARRQESRQTRQEEPVRAETTAEEQPVSKPEVVEPGVIEEDSPELGQTPQ
jgi:hypothetical protein